MLRCNETLSYSGHLLSAVCKLRADQEEIVRTCHCGQSLQEDHHRYKIRTDAQTDHPSCLHAMHCFWPELTTRVNTSDKDYLDQHILCFFQ